MKWFHQWTKGNKQTTIDTKKVGEDYKRRGDDLSIYLSLCVCVYICVCVRGRRNEGCVGSSKSFLCEQYK